MKAVQERISGPRLYCDHALSAECETNLPESGTRHVAALRLQPGDALTVFNGRGGEYRATVIETGKRGARVQIHEHVSIERESALQITLALGISSGDRMDYSLQKATELGVSAVQPIATSRSVVKLAGERAEKRTVHWQSVVIAACEQSGRNRVPVVSPVMALPDYLAMLAEDGCLLMLTPGAQMPLKQHARAASVTLLIGAEGGLSPDERDMALSKGFEPVSLGPRILRTETAPVAAIATLQALWGDF